MWNLILDDTVQANAYGWTPDAFADALRGPADSDRRILRQHGSGKGGLRGGEDLFKCI